MKNQAQENTRRAQTRNIDEEIRMAKMEVANRLRHLAGAEYKLTRAQENVKRLEKLKAERDQNS